MGLGGEEKHANEMETRTATQSTELMLVANQEYVATLHFFRLGLNCML